jgi:probable HAF family extracellular repeat protein
MTREISRPRNLAASDVERLPSLFGGVNVAEAAGVKTLRLVVFVALFAATTRPSAQDDVFFMALPPEVLPAEVGANAFSVVGTFYEGGALAWMPTSGTTNLGGRSGQAVSLDGKTIIGRALDSRGYENAAIWERGRSWRVLGSFRPDAQACDNLLSGTFGASDDGKVIVGLGWNGCRIAHAFRWEESTGMVDLGSTNANSSRANGVSGDGRVVVGWQEHETGFRQGAKWITGQQELIRIAAGRVTGEAHAANRDGSIIVGRSCDPFNPDPAHPDTSAAWKWTASGGVRCFAVERPRLLPNLPYTAIMQKTSDDGRVIGGAFSFGLDSEALVWIDDHGYFLKDYLADHGQPDAFRRWVNTGFVTGVSPDGRTLVGYGAGPTAFQGYVVILPERDRK